MSGRESGSDGQSDELEALAAAVRDFCREQLPEPTLARPGRVRDAAAARSGWQRMSAELGLGAVLIGEEYDGAGGSLLEAGRVAEVLGAELATVPFLPAAVLAPTLLGALAAGPDGAAAADLLRRIATDHLLVAVAWAEVDPGVASGVMLDVAGASASYHYVIDADIADVVLLVGGRGHQVVACDAADLTITAQPTFDLTRGIAEVHAERAPGTLIGAGDQAVAAFKQMRRVGRLVLAVESAGGAQAALRLAVDYAHQRVQFGREIGSFQAIKHILADAFVAAESALSVARLAIDAALNEAPDAAELTTLATFFPAEKYADVATAGIQVHGGIGFTVECPAHLYRRRAESNRHLLGDPARLKKAYVDTIAEGQVSA